METDEKFGINFFNFNVVNSRNRFCTATWFICSG